MQNAPVGVPVRSAFLRDAAAGTRIAAIALTWALAAGAAAQAQQASPAEPVRKNVSVVLTVGKTGAEAQDRSFKLVGQDGNRASMLVGWRMPIPTTAKSGDGTAPTAGEPALNYTYQNVGVTADLDLKILSTGSVLLAGTIEVSGVREGKALVSGEKMPIIGTFNQRLTVLAAQNKKMRVAEVPDPDGGTLHIDVEVDVLD